VVEAAGGLINAIGLQNMGARAFIEGPLAELKNRRAVVGANVVGRTIGEYLAATEILLGGPVDLLELNISCPNLAGPGGLSFGADPSAAAELTEAVAARVKGSGRPLWVKLPPLVSDIALLARTVEAAGADAISLINTLPGMAIDLETRRPKLGHAQGGLSGPPVKPLALRQVFLAARAVKIPVIGIGGITGPIDALEFLAAGAVAVQMGTAILVDPRSPARTIEGMAAWLEERAIPDLADVIGSLRI
jgi:dihydroorotate dehydrogenase (NAD+) catalytic subunit